MVVTEKIELPTEEELTVPEINLSFPVLQAAAFHVGKYCENQSNEFLLCKSEENDPRKCIYAGKELTSCALEFFKKLKKTCSDEFTQYYNCIDKSSGLVEFSPCRKTQAIFDNCVLDNLQLERPPFGYFCEIKIHDSQRPKPKSQVLVYPDAAVPMSTEEPLLPPKYHSRRMWAQ